MGRVLKSSVKVVSVTVERAVVRVVGKVSPVHAVVWIVVVAG